MLLQATLAVVCYALSGEYKSCRLQLPKHRLSPPATTRQIRQFRHQNHNCRRFSARYSPRSPEGRHHRCGFRNGYPSLYTLQTGVVYQFPCRAGLGDNEFYESHATQTCRNHRGGRGWSGGARGRAESSAAVSGGGTGIGAGANARGRTKDEPGEAADDGRTGVSIQGVILSWR